jgi:hypothetical protein
MAPSRGPESRARNKDKIEPIDDLQLCRFEAPAEHSPINVIAAAMAHGKMYGYLTNMGTLSNVSGHFKAGDSTVAKAVRILVLVNHQITYRFHQ